MSTTFVAGMSSDTTRLLCLRVKSERGEEQEKERAEEEENTEEGIIGEHDRRSTTDLITRRSLPKQFAK